MAVHEPEFSVQSMQSIQVVVVEWFYTVNMAGTSILEFRDFLQKLLDNVKVYVNWQNLLSCSKTDGDQGLL